MNTATITIEGISPYSQSKHHTTPKDGEETNDAHERRTWRNRMHVDREGYVYVPPMAFKNGLVLGAKFLNRKIPGERNKTFTKRFEAGVLCMEPMTLKIKAAEVPHEELFVPSDGVRGSGKRVVKLFPKIDDWGGTVDVQVIDNKISEDVMLEHVEALGKFIGLGRFRPANNGFYGRFAVKKLVWK